jgi:hypothetical protein
LVVEYCANRPAVSRKTAVFESLDQQFLFFEEAILNVVSNETMRRNVKTRASVFGGAQNDRAAAKCGSKTTDVFLVGAEIL